MPRRVDMLEGPRASHPPPPRFAWSPSPASGGGQRSPDALSEAAVAEFLDLARSANVTFDIVLDQLHMRMVNPVWSMWKPIRHLLNEIGQERIEAFMRRDFYSAAAVERSALASAERLHLGVEVMRSESYLFARRLTVARPTIFDIARSSCTAWPSMPLRRPSSFESS